MKPRAVLAGLAGQGALDMREVKQTDTVYELVKQEGVDVSDWSRSLKSNISPASNPKYCYEWAFLEDGKVAVLNIWRDAVQGRGDSQIIEFDPWARITDETGPRKKRAEKFNKVLLNADQQKIPIRIILLDGQREGIDAPSGEKTKVFSRVLDPIEWSIAELNKDKKRFRLERGSRRYADQYSITSEETHAEKQTRTSDVFVRNPRVREAALNRAAGNCEYCGVCGFETSQGRIYLETHHVIPLSEGGIDSIENVVGICAGHHREAHFGKTAGKIRKALLEKQSVATG
jgi:5-methylcytosine-specific restriction enzyme A